MLPAGLAVAFVAIVVTAILDDDAATAPAPQPTETPGETVDFSGSPRIGEDHWHAVFTYVVCDVVQPPAPEWVSGIHTHGDGIIHMHPFQVSEEGDGARLVKWFEYGAGVLDEDEVRLPGDSQTHSNGDECPDGSPGVVQVWVNGERLDDYMRFIPQDGDRITIVFGAELDFIRAVY